ncbi:methionyl-tRNA formyltransferase [Mucilaginibacter sp. RS28]|uniref:Methionyl-tRNA formyltransferase n=1 Tax=Mucilaginibacter straminoryzae TaxID=2932774 RepID=A0A9X1X4U3_9SPHI|nr:methionyl-tRNA formyltransferase [Mucilaginibacter straminoryzae]MCJ8210100.1 methionyl-tRNA formyltransferase [Mucilaginibacter straminoryzae]
MRIVFMGTPEFAVASLEALLDAGCDIVGVVTAPDKPAGRGQQLSESAVKKFAVANHLKVLQPEKLKDPQFLEELKALRADLQVVVAFRMLPEAVWNMPPRGTINLHASLLPQYRGAAPINWAIINGEKETGVTTFFLKHEIDTGNILFTEKITLFDDFDAGILHDKLMNKGAGLLVKTVKAVESGRYTEQPQEHVAEGVQLKHAPKIFKDDCRVDWNKPVEQVHNLVRGLSPYPTAFTEFNGKTLKIFKAEKELAQPSEAPGSFASDGKTYLKVACTDGYLKLLDVQLEGKKRMGVEEFLRGVRL